MSKVSDRYVVVKSVGRYSDGTYYVFDNVLKRIDYHLADQDLQAQRFQYRLKRIEQENESLEDQIKLRVREVSRLNKQLREKQEQYSVVKHERDVLEMQLLAELRNSKRLESEVDELTSIRRGLLNQIDRIQEEHIDNLRKRLDGTR